MGLIPPADAGRLRQLLVEKLPKPVKLVAFLRERSPLVLPGREEDPAGESSEAVKSLLTELAGLSDRISVETHDLDRDADLARGRGVERAPAILVGGDDARVRYYGFPGGHEFMAFLADLADASAGTTALKPETKTALAGLASDVRLLVFVTPT
ncbi:MAG: hypothetical protein L0216_12185 [Planctomycetales bacterium]|nr:hypothetical protein [Planctomycetales bacterium]